MRGLYWLSLSLAKIFLWDVLLDIHKGNSPQHHHRMMGADGNIPKVKSPEIRGRNKRSGPNGLGSLN
jgi:hypothetical protein